MELETEWVYMFDDPEYHLKVGGQLVCDTTSEQAGEVSAVSLKDGEKCRACEAFVEECVPLALACKYARVPEGRVFDLGMG